MLRPTASFERVTRNTAPDVNRRIADETARRLRSAATGGADAIERRLSELDREWDIERVIGTVAPAGILLGLGLGVALNRRFLAIPAVAAAALIMHGLQGWAPPLPVLRRLGVRTAEEIDEERYALRLLRGDFRDLPAEPDRVLAAVRH